VHLALPRREPHAQPHRDAADIVVIEVVPEIVVAIRDLPLHRQRARRRQGHQALLRGQEGRRAVPRDHLLDAPRADLECRQHRLDVAEIDLGRAAVRLVQRQDVGIDRAALDQAHRRDLQPFLEIVGEARRDAGGHAAADIGGVDEVPGIGDHRAVMEQRPDQVQVRHVGGQSLRDIGVVGQHHVARLRIGHQSHRRGHVAVEKPRHTQRPGIRKEPPPRRRQRAAEIPGLLHVRGPGRPLQRNRHLLRNRRKPMIQNLKENRIDHCPQTLNE
jgi:hypothetical protein